MKLFCQLNVGTYFIFNDKAYQKAEPWEDGTNAISIPDMEPVYFELGTPVEPAFADYIIFTGEERDTSRPSQSAFTLDGACATADELAKTNKYVQVVFMPEDDEDINETVLEIIEGKVLV